MNCNNLFETLNTYKIIKKKDIKKSEREEILI